MKRTPGFGVYRIQYLLAACMLALLIPACGDSGTSPDENERPNAQGQSVTTPKTVPILISLVGQDDQDVTLLFELASAPQNGTLTTITSVFSNRAETTYTPNAGFAGADAFTFTVNDGSQTSTPATVNITVTNAVPTVQSFTLQGLEGEDVPVTLTGDDTDDDPLTFTIVTAPVNGVLTSAPPVIEAGADAVVTDARIYRPNAGFTGVETFTYTATDGFDTSTEATVEITVLPEAPVAQPTSATTTKNTPVLIPLTGTDANGDPLTFAIDGGPTNGALGAINQTSPTTAEVTYTPNGGFSGMDEFTFTVNDGDDTSPAAAVMIDVENQQPVANAGPDQANVMKGQVVTLDGSASTDPDGDPIVFSWSLLDGSSQDQTGLLSDPNAAQPTFTPTTSGDWVATLSVTDGSAVVNVPDQVTITVVNKVPTASPQTVGTGVGAAVVILLAGDDGDGDPLTFAVETDPTNGTLGPIVPATPAGGDVGANATVTYTPNGGFEGSDSFTFTVTDGEDTSAAATVTVNVAAGPIAGGAAVVTNQEIGSFITLTGTDPLGAGLTFQIVTPPTNGTLGPVEQIDPTSASVTYVPNLGFQGSDSFTFTVTDAGPSANATSPEATVDVTVGGPTEAAIIAAFPNINKVGVFNSATGQEIALIDVGTTPNAVKLTPNEEFLYVGNIGDATVSVIRTSTASVIATLNVGGLPRLIEVHPNGSTVYVGNLASDDISIIDVATQTVTGTFKPAGLIGLTDLSVDPDGEFLYATDPNTGVYALDISDPPSPAGSLDAGGTMNTPTDRFFFPVMNDPFEGRSVRHRRIFVVRGATSNPLLNGTNGDQIITINTPGGLSNPFGTGSSRDGRWAFVSYGSTGQRIFFRANPNAAPSRCSFSTGGFPSGRATILNNGSIIVSPTTNVVQIYDGTGCRATSMSYTLTSTFLTQAAPIFADGFESGDATSWSSNPRPNREN